MAGDATGVNMAQVTAMNLAAQAGAGGDGTCQWLPKLQHGFAPVDPQKLSLLGLIPNPEGLSLAGMLSSKPKQGGLGGLLDDLVKRVSEPITSKAEGVSDGGGGGRFAVAEASFGPGGFAPSTGSSGGLNGGYENGLG